MNSSGLMLVQKPINLEKPSGVGSNADREIVPPKGKEGKEAKASRFREIIDALMPEKGKKKAEGSLLGKTDLNGKKLSKEMSSAKKKGEDDSIHFFREGKLDLKGPEESNQRNKKLRLIDSDIEEALLKMESMVSDSANQKMKTHANLKGMLSQDLHNSGKDRNTRDGLRADLSGKNGLAGEKRPTLTVVDLRTDRVEREQLQISTKVKNHTRDSSSNMDNRNDSGDTVIVVKGDGNQSQPQAASVKSGHAAEFTGQLDRLLKGDLGKEIVKQTGIVVKDNGKGEIRLVLEPEQLGKVRIRLDLDDNHIAAKILVENNSIREVFEQNLEHLSRTLREGGFLTDSLDVSVQGDGTGNKGRGKHGSVQQRLADELEALIPLAEDEIREETTVNMVV